MFSVSILILIEFGSFQCEKPGHAPNFLKTCPDARTGAKKEDVSGEARTYGNPKRIIIHTAGRPGQSLRDWKPQQHHHGGSPHKSQSQPFKPQTTFFIFWVANPVPATQLRQSAEVPSSVCQW